MRTKIPVQREIVRLLTLAKYSYREIGEMLGGITHKVVSYIHRKLQNCSVETEDLLRLDDLSFEKKLGTKSVNKKSDLIEPDWRYIQEELTKRDMTIALLWQEYRDANKEQSERCISYAHFAKLYREWIKSQRISMRQYHAPGQKMFVDFCGRTMEVTNPETGEIIKAQIFVSVLGCSGYIFAHAVASQKIADWTECNVKAVEYYEGSPVEIVPDNLKAAVLKNTSDIIRINNAYSEFAEHYQIIINPARSRKPKDKSMAEVSVQIVQKWALSALRNYRFFSLDELNTEIYKKVNELNNKTSKTYTESRYSRYLSMDKPSLNPLPSKPFEIFTWRYNYRVPSDYHVVLNKAYYSVPYQYRGQVVNIKTNGKNVEIFLERVSIATHQVVPVGTASTKDEHRPIEHLQFKNGDKDSLLNWAEAIGENTFKWAKKNTERRDFANGVKSISKLRQWAKDENKNDRLESACRYALSINTITFNDVKRIIVNNSDLIKVQEHVHKVIDHENIRGKEYYSIEGEELC
jgi:transposase